MPNGDLRCTEHSGCLARITNVEEDIHDMKTRHDSIFTRLNIILGGIAVACVLLAVNILVTMPAK